MSVSEETAIRVVGLGKVYKLYSRPIDILAELITRRDAVLFALLAAKSGVDLP